MELRNKLLMILGLVFGGTAFAANTKEEIKEVVLATPSLEGMPVEIKYLIVEEIVNQSPDYTSACKRLAVLSRTNREFNIIATSGFAIKYVARKFFKNEQQAQNEFFKLSRNGKLTAFVLAVLQKAGADLDIQNKLGSTALLVAVTCGHKEIVAMLIKAKVNLNTQNRNGYAALIVAAGFGHKEIVAMLIKAKANLNMKGGYGYTALMWAAAHGYKEIIGMLIKAGADLNTQNDFGRTALDIAKEYGQEEIAQMLEQAISEQSKQGKQEENKKDKNRN